LNTIQKFLVECEDPRSFCIFVETLKIGAKIKTKFHEEQICEVKDFIINRGLLSPGILVQTDYGNVYYYETKKV